MFKNKNTFYGTLFKKCLINSKTQKRKEKNKTPPECWHFFPPKPKKKPRILSRRTNKPKMKDYLFRNISGV
ncbi:hypothetical protein ACQWFX_24685, partial [Salmonella enterica subsp. enterica serovar Infantis]